MRRGETLVSRTRQSKRRNNWAVRKQLCGTLMNHQSITRSVRFNNIVTAYGAMYILDVLADFIAQINYLDVSIGAFQSRSRNTVIPFSSVHVFHKIKFTSSNSSDIVDTIHVRAERKNPNGCIIPARFDTVLVRSKDSNTIHRANGKRQSY